MCPPRDVFHFHGKLDIMERDQMLMDFKNACAERPERTVLLLLQVRKPAATLTNLRVHCFT